MNKHFNVAVEGDDGGLVICRGCKARGTYATLPSGECPTPYKPNSVLLKESLAREHALQQRLTAADQQTDDLRAELAANPNPDPVLCKFYDVDDWAGLVRELVDHVAQLQDAAKRNVKPWEDTFPPTLLPAYVERVNIANAVAQHQSEPVAWICHGPKGSGLVALQWSHLPPPAGLERKIPLRAEQPAPVAVLMSFDFEHPSSKERRTVALSKQDVLDGMEDYFYDKLGEQICRCEPVGETNVVDCSCDEYVHDFEIVKASLTS